MSIGIAPTSAAEVNNIVGGTARSLYSVLNQVKQIQAWLLATDLKAAPYSFSVGDEANIKSAYTDLDKLRTVFEGTATQTPAYDARTFAKLLIGPTY
jgi:hypothetical protein